MPPALYFEMEVVVAESGQNIPGYIVVNVVVVVICLFCAFFFCSLGLMINHSWSWIFSLIVFGFAFALCLMAAVYLENLWPFVISKKPNLK